VLHRELLDRADALGATLKKQTSCQDTSATGWVALHHQEDAAGLVRFDLRVSPRGRAGGSVSWNPFFFVHETPARMSVPAWAFDA
jgi:hypothetical protein